MRRSTVRDELGTAYSHRSHRAMLHAYLDIHIYWTATLLADFSSRRKANACAEYTALISSPVSFVTLPVPSLQMVHCRALLAELLAEELLA